MSRRRARFRNRRVERSPELPPPTPTCSSWRDGIALLGRLVDVHRAGGDERAQLAAALKILGATVVGRAGRPIEAVFALADELAARLSAARLEHQLQVDYELDLATYEWFVNEAEGKDEIRDAIAARPDLIHRYSDSDTRVYETPEGAQVAWERHPVARNPERWRFATTLLEGIPPASAAAERDAPLPRSDPTAAPVEPAPLPPEPAPEVAGLLLAIADQGTELRALGALPELARMDVALRGAGHDVLALGQLLTDITQLVEAARVAERAKIRDVDHEVHGLEVAVDDPPPEHAASGELERTRAAPAPHSPEAAPLQQAEPAPSGPPSDVRVETVAPEGHPTGDEEAAALAAAPDPAQPAGPAPNHAGEGDEGEGARPGEGWRHQAHVHGGDRDQDRIAVPDQGRGEQGEAGGGGAPDVRHDGAPSGQGEHVGAEGGLIPPCLAFEAEVESLERSASEILDEGARAWALRDLNGARTQEQLAYCRRMILDTLASQAKLLEQAKATKEYIARAQAEHEAKKRAAEKPKETAFQRARKSVRGSATMESAKTDPAVRELRAEVRELLKRAWPVGTPPRDLSDAIKDADWAGLQIHKEQLERLVAALAARPPAPVERAIDEPMPWEEEDE